MAGEAAQVRQVADPIPIPQELALQLGPASPGGGVPQLVPVTRLRHANAVTTLGIYVHMWSDRDESTRATIGGVLAARADWVRTRTGP